MRKKTCQSAVATSVAGALWQEQPVLPPSVKPRGTYFVYLFHLLLAKMDPNPWNPELWMQVAVKKTRLVRLHYSS